MDDGRRPWCDGTTAAGRNLRWRMRCNNGHVSVYTSAIGRTIGIALGRNWFCNAKRRSCPCQPYGRRRWPGFMALAAMERSAALSKESAEEISAHCQGFAAAFEARFGSLLCRQLRPQGFPQDGPSHACEMLTAQAVAFARQWLLAEKLQGKMD